MEFEINGKSRTINLTWLRDNCRCMQCFNHKTNQRKKFKIEVQNLNIQKYTIQGENLKIIWYDGHSSKYNLNWIQNYFTTEITSHEILWAGNEIQEQLPTFNEQNIVNDKDTKSFIECLLKYGVAIVKNVPLTIEDFKNTVFKIGSVMQTLYGRLWMVNTQKSNLENFQDTAYTNFELGVHTDNTYFHEPAGLIIFHCLKQANRGGETTLVDGYKAASILKNINEDFYNCLKTVPLEWQYKSAKNYYSCIKPIINTYGQTETLEQIRFNIYDRSPRMPLTPLNNLNKFYFSLQCFTKILQDENVEWKIQLTPGTIIFINNWRVLHGRKEFEGSRSFLGCYIAMNTFLRKAKVFKLLF